MWQLYSSRFRPISQYFFCLLSNIYCSTTEVINNYLGTIISNRVINSPEVIMERLLLPVCSRFITTILVWYTRELNAEFMWKPAGLLKMLWILSLVITRSYLMKFKRLPKQICQMRTRNYLRNLNKNIWKNEGFLFGIFATVFREWQIHMRRTNTDALKNKCKLVFLSDHSCKIQLQLAINHWQFWIYVVSFGYKDM